METSWIAWIADQQQHMLKLVEEWSAINSGSSHLPGLKQMLHTLLDAFAPLKGERSTINLAPTYEFNSRGECIERMHGAALLIQKRPKAPLRLLLGGHMDTVYDHNSPFQHPYRCGENKLYGPGVADMKGGLVILLIALQALEKSPYSSQIGWDVLITPDEEIGSIASFPLWRRYAWQNHYALLFEPSLPDGAVVSSRKGSFTYLITSQGKSAHAGRDFYQGVNAVTALSRLAVAASDLKSCGDELTVNIGMLQGGSTANTIPDSATCLINARAQKLATLLDFERSLFTIAEDIEIKTRATIAIHLRSRRPPKPIDMAMQHLLSICQRCATSLRIPYSQRSVGGVCDGNLLAAEGIATLDSLGVIGGALHTEEEWLLIPSLVERSQLTASLLFELASSQKHLGRSPS